MNDIAGSGGTPPTDFTVDPETLRHGHVHVRSGHTASTDTRARPDGEGTQHRAPVSEGAPMRPETMHDRLRAAMRGADGGE